MDSENILNYMDSENNLTSNLLKLYGFREHLNVIKLTKTIWIQRTS